LLFDSLPNASFLHPKLIQGMDLIRSNKHDFNTQAEALKLFKELADDYNPEACWRVAVFYLKGWSVPQDNFKSQFYSQIAIDCDIVEGFYWYGKTVYQYNQDIPYIKEAADRNLPCAQFLYGEHIQWYHSTKKRWEKGNQFMIKAAKSGDSVFAKKVVYFYRRGISRFKRDDQEADRFDAIASLGNSSDCSFFDED
jgi:TPR repeat protein